MDVFNYINKNLGNLDISRSIAADDTMYDFMEHYISVGISGVKVLLLALAAANKRIDSVNTILDLPCGHGRVLRVIKKVFESAEITSCDISKSGVDFCKNTFGSVPIYSCREVPKIQLNKKYDLIWCGSLVTHFNSSVWREVFDLFENHLNTGGIMVFSYHGPFVARRIQNDENYGLADKQMKELIRQYRDTGFGFVTYGEDPLTNFSTGVSLANRVWVVNMLEYYSDLDIVMHVERGWDNHQDVIACMKR